MHIGGIITVAVDFAGLREYIRINPTIRRLDDFVEELVDYGFIEEEITERCQLEASLTTTRNIQLTLSAVTDEDSDFCSDASERLAAAINDPSSISGDSQFVQVPEVLQFASAAIAGMNDGASSGTLNGAPALVNLSYLTSLLLIAITFLLL